MHELNSLNLNYSEAEVKKAIAEALKEFYHKLTENLDKINLAKILKRKNPYLYKAKGITKASLIVKEILSAYVSSSEETIFGNVFFEPLALVVSGGQKAVTEGMDITVDRGQAIYSIAVKSGVSVFNSDSRKRQEQNFQAAAKRARQAKKVFYPVVGYGYGKKTLKSGQKKFYSELAGQKFWAWLTGDRNFYLKIVEYMENKPEEYAKQFEEIYNRTENRLLREFAINFCYDDGSIDWDKLVKFNSDGTRQTNK